MSTKSCSQCATTKPKSGFSKTQGKKPAAVTRCLACVAAGPAPQRQPRIKPRMPLQVDAHAPSVAERLSKAIAKLEPSKSDRDMAVKCHCAIRDALAQAEMTETTFLTGSYVQCSGSLTSNLLSRACSCTVTVLLCCLLRTLTLRTLT